MIGVVVVAHTNALASAVAEVAGAVAGHETRVVAAGPTDPDATGVDPEAIRAAISTADTGDGVVVLMDIGSSVLNAKVVLADLADVDEAPDLRLADAPFVEGAIAAAVTGSTGQDVDAVLAAAEAGWGMRKL